MSIKCYCSGVLGVCELELISPAALTELCCALLRAQQCFGAVLALQQLCLSSTPPALSRLGVGRAHSQASWHEFTKGTFHTV